MSTIKRMLTCLMAAGSFICGTDLATANDGTIPYIEVLGIKPSVPVPQRDWEDHLDRSFANRQLVVTGGVGPLFEALYYHGIQMNSSLMLVSNSYSVSIDCSSAAVNMEYPDYRRGPQIDLYPHLNSCRFGISRWGKDSVLNDGGDTTEVKYNMRRASGEGLRIDQGVDNNPKVYPEFNGQIPSVQYVGSILDADGLRPQKGMLWSIYGKDAQFFARLMENFSSYYGASHSGQSTAWFIAPQGTLAINCLRDYYRPTNNERRTDYMCEFSFN